MFVYKVYLFVMEKRATQKKTRQKRVNYPPRKSRVFSPTLFSASLSFYNTLVIYIYIYPWHHMKNRDQLLIMNYLIHLVGYYGECEVN